MNRSTFEQEVFALSLETARLDRDTAKTKLETAQLEKERMELALRSFRLAMAEHVDLTKLPKFS
jgi:hypothetical protein